MYFSPINWLARGECQVCAYVRSSAPSPLLWIGCKECWICLCVGPEYLWAAAGPVVVIRCANKTTLNASKESEIELTLATKALLGPGRSHPSPPKLSLSSHSYEWRRLMRAHTQWVFICAPTSVVIHSIIKGIRDTHQLARGVCRYNPTQHARPIRKLRRYVMNETRYTQPAGK